TLERGKALAERARAADAPAPRDEGTALSCARLLHERLGVEAELGDGVARLACARIDRSEQARRKGLLPRLDLGQHLRLGRQARVERAGFQHMVILAGRTSLIGLRVSRKWLGAKIGLLPILKLCLALVEVGRDFGDP